MLVRTIRAGLFLVAMSAFFSFGQTPTPAETGIEGTIMISPSHPGPTRVDEPNAAPLANVNVEITNESGAVTNFRTDAQGKFRILLKPGRYKVSVKVRRCGPFDVDVAASGMTTVQWQCDSRMR